MKHTSEFIGRQLLVRSEVDPASPIVEGRRCRMWRGASPWLWDGERVREASHLAYELKAGRQVPAGKDVLHRCDRPGCVEPVHIYAGKLRQDTADMAARGRHLEGRRLTAEKLRGRPSAVRGERHKAAKLDEEDARAIKARLRSKRNRPSALAREFGVSDSLIRGIRDGRNWSWLS